MFKFNQKIKIGSRTVGEGFPVFIIGEIGSNHNLSMNQAKKLIDVASAAGVDAVKFQSLRFEQLYLSDRAPLALKELHKKIDLSERFLCQLFVYAKKKGLIFFSCATYFEAINTLEKLGVLIHKIASPITFGFGELITAISKTKKPLIVSTGYCEQKEIDRAVKLIMSAKNHQLILLHCVSSYPLSPDWAALGFIRKLKKRYDCLVGFSDHTLSLSLPAVAVALGAKVIEKHFTLSRKMKGPDHKFALEPAELAQMVKNIRETEKALASKRKLLPPERKFRETIIMKLIAAIDLFPGTVLKKNHFIYRRSLGGIEEFRLSDVIGRKVLHPVKKLTPINWGDIDRK